MRRPYINKNIINRYGKRFYDKTINRIILVLVILLVVLIIRVINTNGTNYIIQIIEKNIHYEFSLKDDGNRVKNYLKKTVDNSKVAIEELTKGIMNIQK